MKKFIGFIFYLSLASLFAQHHGSGSLTSSNSELDSVPELTEEDRINECNYAINELVYSFVGKSIKFKQDNREEIKKFRFEIDSLLFKYIDILKTIDRSNRQVVCKDSSGQIKSQINEVKYNKGLHYFKSLKVNKCFDTDSYKKVIANIEIDNVILVLDFLSKEYKVSD